jgi:hypothetical protein
LHLDVRRDEATEGREGLSPWGRALGKALKRPVIVVLTSRSADANWKGERALQETAHSAKTIILDDSDQRTSIWYRMAERNGAR